MRINRIRLLGFKSFVEPTELVVERGLTGVVGPNGCGKSNLLEALRWVMGETSHKSMRAASMDDVIFSGTTQRPARNIAEVTIFLDNKQRSAPAEFNDHDIIEITRRIEREAGSAYRINGRDVRARDVKILFEDAATGARSPALVRQGQIAEIVNAKPEQRRRILEDAAGVAGLHSRRHDAELRLKAAETNLARLADIMGSLTSQLESLKRQARQARRYKELSVEIRKAEAVALHVSWSQAQTQVDAEEVALREVLVRLGAAAEAESATLRLEAGLTASLQPLREEEATRGAILARLKIEQENFEKEAERAISRQKELAGRASQLGEDLARESAAIDEASEIITRLDGELLDLAEADEGAAEAEDIAQTQLDDARAAEAQAAARMSDITRRDAHARALANSLAQQLTERREQAAKFERQVTALQAQLRDIAARAPDAAKLAEQQELGAELSQSIEDGETTALDADERLAAAAATAKERRETAQRASLDLRGIDAEQATLARMLRPRLSDGLPPMLDLVTVARGFEAAFGAALGDDLDAPLEAAAGDAQPPMHWRQLDPPATDAALPAGVQSLAAKVKAPPALARRLAQTGVADRSEAAALQPKLLAGQRLVSKQGDLWRWDGFVATADAPTAAAERLAQKNRLAEIEQRQAELSAVAATAIAADHAAQAEVTAAEAVLRQARNAVRDAQGQLVRVRDTLNAAERASRETEGRLETIRAASEQASEALLEAHERIAETQAALDFSEEDRGLETELAAAEDATRTARARVMQVAGEAAGLERERKLRVERLSAMRADRQRWATRSESAARQIETLRTRTAEAKAELATLNDLPTEIEAQRQRLFSSIADAERQRSTAADKLAQADSAMREAQQSLRAAQAAVGAEREVRAGVEARLEAGRQRSTAEAHKIRETLGCEPEDCLAFAEFPEGGTLPAMEDIERQLARLKADRERLGGVNLAADQELETINTQLESMDKERLDVEEAIAKLRGAIGQLNREGKKRIDEAFQAVNAHFQSLFTTLFGGGEARLEMIESEDPLEGGLEIIAKPPGKKPATLSLLSGGEQTLTALSLIFAVFLTNPSPICVLDEVDAPLDDANVDRFSTLMEKMAAETDTRFLVITHHPMTMARMNRLFGVTMGERGVSQLVSVDLATAERIIEDQPDLRAANG